MFADAVRSDAARVAYGLHARGLAVEMASGDHVRAVTSVVQKVGIDVWRAACSPAQKMAHLESLKAQGRCVLMVRDGLNDAPALAAADVSMSPTSAADISQTAADIVFQGDGLSPILDVYDVARLAHKLVRQNLSLALLYNVVTVPLAVAGYVTPLFAALSMSVSSIIVIVNAFRLMSWTRTIV